MVPCNLVYLGSASGDIDRETLPPASGAGKKTHVCKVFVQDRLLKKKQEGKKHEQEDKVSEAGVQISPDVVEDTSQTGGYNSTDD
jgi:hypothetical protein